jgi:hypothetical protein
MNPHPGHVQVLVVVQRQSRVQQHDGNHAADGADHVGRKLPVLRCVWKRRAEVETHGNVLAWQVLQRGAALDPRERRVLGVLLEHADAGLLEPEEPQQPVHGARVQHLDVRQSQLRLHPVDDVAVHFFQAILLLVPGLVPAELVRLPVFVQREDVEDIDVLGGDVAIPEPRAATGHHDQAPPGETELLERPVQKRDPVEQLVADFADPRADDDRRIALRQWLDLLSHRLGVRRRRQFVELVLQE